MAPAALVPVTLPKLCTTSELLAQNLKPICAINQYFNTTFIDDLKGFAPHGSAEMSGNVDV